MKKLTALLFIPLLSGCLSTPKETDRFTVNMNKTAAEQTIYSHARASWAQPVIPILQDGYMVETQNVGGDTTSITVSRFGNGMAKQPPFTTVDLTKVSTQQTLIEVYEGDAYLGKYENFTPDVRTWLHMPPKAE